jgi:hypothetical protein
MLSMYLSASRASPPSSVGVATAPDGGSRGGAGRSIPKTVARLAGLVLGP